MKISITIGCGNVAFSQPGPEIARILREFAAQITEAYGLKEIEAFDDWPMVDLNGNNVGSFTVTN